MRGFSGFKNSPAKQEKYLTRDEEEEFVDLTRKDGPRVSEKEKKDKEDKAGSYAKQKYIADSNKKSDLKADFVAKGSPHKDNIKLKKAGRLAKLGYGAARKR